MDFWRPSWIDNGYFISLYSIYGSNHLYQFSTKWTIDAPIVIFYHFFIKCRPEVVICKLFHYFSNQFWPNLVPTYKFPLWKSFGLCVVFKCQYFWSYSRKTHFLTFIYIFQRAVTHSKITRLTRFFLLQLQDIPFKFFVLCVVLKSQYFFSYSRKMTVYNHILKDPYLLKNCYWPNFFPQVQNIPIKFYCSLSLITF